MASRKQKPTTLSVPFMPKGQKVVLAAPPKKKSIVAGLAKKGTASGSRFVWRKAYARRRHFAPLILTALVQTLAVVFHHIHNGPRAIFCFNALAGLCLWWWMRRRAKGKRALTMWQQRYALAVYATAGLLAQVTAVAGPPILFIPILLALAGGGPWWWHHRVRPTKPVAEPVAVWMEYVSANDGALPGSVLANPESGDGLLFKATIELPRGKANTEKAINATSLVASAYAAPQWNVNIEATEDRRENAARITVYERNPLQSVQLFPGPDKVLDPTTGIATIGVYHDGEPVPYSVWEPGSGPVHDLICGTTGAGKSRLVDGLLAMERVSPLMCSLVIDPQRGQSLPDWQNSVDWFAPSVKSGMRLLRAFDRMIDRRNAYLARLRWTDDEGYERPGKSFFDPTPELPIISLTIEETHMVVNDPDYGEEAIYLLAKNAKIIRKCGGRLRLVNQSPLLEELGNNSTLRQMVKGGNGIVFRTADRIVGQVVFQSALPVDPASIPRKWPGTLDTTAGLGYIVGGTDRAAQFRAYFVKNPYKLAIAPGAGKLSDLDVAAAGDDLRYWRDWYDTDLDDLDPPKPGATTVIPLSGLNAAKASPSAPASGSIPERILAYLRQRDQATAGVIAHDLGGLKLSSTCSALSRLVKEGQVREVGGSDRKVYAAAVNATDSEAGDVTHG